jgi:hypothetical protein
MVIAATYAILNSRVLAVLQYLAVTCRPSLGLFSNDSIPNFECANSQLAGCNAGIALGQRYWRAIDGPSS